MSSQPLLEIGFISFWRHKTHSILVYRQKEGILAHDEARYSGLPSGGQILSPLLSAAYSPNNT
jgi:hypothetical protein